MPWETRGKGAPDSKRRLGKRALGYPPRAVPATSNTASECRSGVRLHIWGAVIAAASFSARPVFCAEPEETRFVGGDATCPAPEAVQAEVFKLTSPEGRAAHLALAQVRVFDDGDAYGVEIREGNEVYRKGYDDPARECSQRARVVAVTIVMTLIPPELGADELVEAEPDAEGPGAEAGAGGPAEPRAEERKPAPPPAQPEAVKASATEVHTPSSQKSASWLSLELGGWFQHSLSNSEVPRIAAWGGELLGAVGPGRVLGLGAISAGASRFELGEVHASMSELSARAGVRFRWPLGGTTVAAEALCVAARRRVEGEAPGPPEASSSWELGASGGANVAFDVWRHVAPVAGVRLSVFPAPSELEAVPRGTLGSMPKLWFGVHAGVRFGL